MSTGADCSFVENEKGEWFYNLQHWPYGDTPEYSKYGPFPSYQRAVTHLEQHHANPGGWSSHAVTLKGKEDAYGWPGGIQPPYVDPRAECGKCGAEVGEIDPTCPQCDKRWEWVNARQRLVLGTWYDKYHLDDDDRRLLEKVIRHCERTKK